MQMHQIKRNINNRKSKRVGRGGKRGKTSGKGTKGQNARSGRKKRPEMRDIIKRFPKLRGRGKNFLKSIQGKPFVVKTSLLESKFASGESVNPKTLFEKGLLKGADVKSMKGGLPKVKIVFGGPLSKKLSISLCEVSAGAKDIIESAGGSVS